jgi:hypothetical protein
MEKEKVPDIVFIIPYRDRIPQKEFFLRYMKYILEDYDKESFEIVFCQQVDKRTFNRGAMKNAGFNYVKTVYPTCYQKITLVFNDIDCVPYLKNLLDYKTSFGKIKHFYGFEYALGGIISITCHDFETINGFPNYWGWGFEDNALQNRVNNKGKYTSRKTFFNIGDNRILHLFDTFKKGSDKNIPYHFSNDDGNNGITTLKTSRIHINKMEIIIPHTIVNVNNFETEYEYNDDNIIERDIREKNQINVVNGINKKKVHENTNAKPLSNVKNKVVFNNILSRKVEINKNGNMLENTSRKIDVVTEQSKKIHLNNPNPNPNPNPPLKSNKNFNMFSWRR